MFCILKILLVADKTCSFPVSKHYQEKGQNLRFQYKWLSGCKWLAYSVTDDGAYYTLIFPSQELELTLIFLLPNWKKQLNI